MPWPTLMPCAARLTPSTTSSKSRSWTYRRLAAEQTSPWLKKIPSAELERHALEVRAARRLRDELADLRAAGAGGGERDGLGGVGVVGEVDGGDLAEGGRPYSRM
jgi:hypothetical protein